MHNSCQKYLRMLRAELENLESDVVSMVDDHERRKLAGEITNYVYMGNTAVLESMLGSIRALLRCVRSVDGARYPGVDDMIGDLDRTFKEKVRQSGFPAAGYAVARRVLENAAHHTAGASALS